MVCALRHLKFRNINAYAVISSVVQTSLGVNQSERENKLLLPNAQKVK